MRKVLLLGGGGQLGTEIRCTWPAAIDAPAHVDLDVANTSAVANTLDKGYDLVVNCAAFHNVDSCEAQPEDAFRFNAIAVDGVAAACAALGTTFMTISTDYVFDGNADRPYVESDCPRPIQVYGMSKLAGEFLAMRHSLNAFVVRTCGIYGVRTSTTKGYTFIDRVLAQLRAGEDVRIVSDVIAAPTYARHLAQALWQIAESGKFGLYHAVNPGPVSWYDFAAEAALQAGVTRIIERISGSAWQAKARRPRYSALASERLGTLGVTLPDWREGIAAYLRDKAAADNPA